MLKLDVEKSWFDYQTQMLSFGNTICAAQMSARPKSSNPFYEKLSIYVSPRVSAVMFALCKNKNLHCYFMMQWILSSTPVPVTKNSNFCCFAHSSKQQNQLSLKLDGILVWFCILNLQLYDRKPIFQLMYIPLFFSSHLNTLISK